MRWAWLDRFIEFTPGQSAVGVKQWPLALDLFGQHFPEFPVVPASLMLEGLAQTGGLLVGEARDFKEKVVLAKISKARFHREVLAGEAVTMETKVLFVRPEGAAVQGRLLVGDELIGEAEITFAHLDQARSREAFGETNFVFDNDQGSSLKLLMQTLREP
jgi:3-hydroxyacyl-[acyl-carrier-protein] dehydratase